LKNKIYDIIIAGGGIGALYTAYKLKKNFPKLSILILEKNDYLGGRIKSSQIAGQSLDLGALRIPDSAKLTLKLIEDLNLEIKKFDTRIQALYTREKLYSKKNLHKSQERFFLPENSNSDQTAYDLLLITILKSLKINNINEINENQKIGSKKICNINIYNFLISKLSLEQIAWLISSLAIDSYLNMNLFEFSQNALINHDYFVIKTDHSEFGNMTEIIKKLDINNQDVTKLLNKKIETASFDEANLQWHIEALDIKYQKIKIFKSKIFISTIPVFAMHGLKIKINETESLKKILESFTTTSRARYYLQYNYKWWQLNYGEFIHPVNERSLILSPKSSIILASYCDENKFRLFQALTDKELSRILHNGLCELFNVDKNITPKPIKIIKQEWTGPDNYVRAGITPAGNRNEILKNLIKPFKSKPFFIISDTITNKSGWIEGALLSAENAFDLIGNLIKKIDC
jgi:monoamine oxidase